MKVILKNDTPRLGPKNTVLDVSDSYAINVLIKKGIADKLTAALEAKINRDKANKAESKELAGSRHLQMIADLQKVASKNSDHTIVSINHNHDNKGHLYGSVTNEEIVSSIYDLLQISINPKQIQISNIIKTTGIHKILIKGNKSEKEMEFNIEVR